jgi:hypothetical protein
MVCAADDLRGAADDLRDPALSQRQYRRIGKNLAWIVQDSFTQRLCWS